MSAEWRTSVSCCSIEDVKLFLDSIEHGRPSDVPVSLAAAATKVLLAAYRSAAEGRAVMLPLETEADIHLSSLAQANRRLIQAN